MVRADSRNRYLAMISMEALGALRSKAIAAWFTGKKRVTIKNDQKH